MSTTVKSRKARARFLQKLVVRRLREHYNLDRGVESCYQGDVQSVPMGMNKEDILLSPKAQKIVPLSFECKNTEKLNVWKALSQAESNSNGRVPVVVFKRNRSKVYACLEFEEFLKLIK